MNETDLSNMNNLTYAISFIKYQQSQCNQILKIISDQAENINKALRFQVNDEKHPNHVHFVIAILAKMFSLPYDN